MHKKNNKKINSTLLFVTIVFFFVVLASTVSIVSAEDLTTNDTDIVTNTEDVNIVDQDLSNSNATVDNNNLNIKNSKLNNSRLSNNNGNVTILENTIKNSKLIFNNNDEIIIKNTKFFNTNITITGANTLYLINCSFVNSRVDANSTNLLTIDLIINKTSNMKLTTDHIWFGGIVFVNDHSNFYLNVSKTRGVMKGNTDNDYYDYPTAFPKAYDLAGFSNHAYTYQLIMVNGSSNATGYINGTVYYQYDIFTFASRDSNDTILGAYEITDHNSNSSNNNLGHLDIDFVSQFGYTYIKAPNGTIYKMIREIYFQGHYFSSSYGSYNFYFSNFYNSIDNGIYNYYSSNDAYLYFDDINYTYQYNNWHHNYLGQMLLFSMMLDYNDTGFTTTYFGDIAQNVYQNYYYVLIKDVYIYNNYLKIYLNDVYNMTYLMIDNNTNDYWYITSGYNYWSNETWNYYYINNLDDLINAQSGELYHNYTNYQNVFLYQNIKYVDENGTVLSTEDMNMLFSLVSMEINIPYTAIKYYYELYGIDGILMLLNVNMDDPDEVNQVKADVEDYINELNRIIDETVIGEVGIDIWKIVVVPSNSTIGNQGNDSNQSSSNNDTNPNDNHGNGNNQTSENNQNSGSNDLTNNNQGNNNTKGNNTKGGNISPKKTTKKADLAILKVQKLKSSINKQVISYKITIKNRGNLKSGKTTLALWHIRHNVKTKVKIVNIKALKPGEKITFVVSYYPDRDCHKYCKKQYFVLNPLKNIKELTYKNNKKILKA